VIFFEVVKIYQLDREVSVAQKTGEVDGPQIRYLKRIQIGIRAMVYSDYMVELFHVSLPLPVDENGISLQLTIGTIVSPKWSVLIGEAIERYVVVTNDDAIQLVHVSPPWVLHTVVRRSIGFELDSRRRKEKSRTELPQLKSKDSTRGKHFLLVRGYRPDITDQTDKDTLCASKIQR